MEESEAKFEDFSIIFAESVIKLVMLYSDEEPCAAEPDNRLTKGKTTIRGKTMEVGGPSNQASRVHPTDMNVPSTYAT